MRKFIVNINGNSYEVEVEEIKGESKPTPKPVQESKPVEPVEVAPVEVSTEQEIVKSPMPGNIWKITSEEGQEVKAGDVLLILEAMKMENEIVAPRDGVISSIVVVEGATVNAGEDLVILD